MAVLITVNEIVQLCLQVLDGSNICETLSVSWRVYLCALFGIHLAAFHQDYPERARHIPHTRLGLLRRKSKSRKGELLRVWSRIMMI